MFCQFYRIENINKHNFNIYFSGDFIILFSFANELKLFFKLFFKTVFFNLKL